MKLKLSLFSIFLILFCFSNQALSQTGPIKGKVALIGNMTKSFDSCSGFPNTFNQKLRVRWNSFVSFIVRDITENGAQSPGGILKNEVIARQTFLMSNGLGYVELAYSVKDFFSSKKKRDVTKFYTYFSNQGKFICQVKYHGKLDHKKIN
ncbi:MAG TPA: hypothetical protein PKA63_12195 [Oligoflexia bacterium]|nr:hypothetical protein [Oligoflexia bacterium]HMP49416.1 hypothetical protein [Oligoflexia bacterium]